jgi:hypothetical protein
MWSFMVFLISLLGATQESTRLLFVGWDKLRFRR